MSEREFTQREDSFGGFGDFAELPEDLRGIMPGSNTDPTAFVNFELDAFQTFGGSDRAFVEPIPGAFGNQSSTWTGINYLPRHNYESFRSQRFFIAGSALVPPTGGAAYTDLLVDIASLPPNSPQISSSGVYTIPAGYAGVITGLRQWIGDATAFQKPSGADDDITWRITAGDAAAFSFGNFPCLISSLDNEARLFVIVTEGVQLQLSVTNTILAGSQGARSIPVKGALTGHQFPIDELDDIFRNR